MGLITNNAPTPVGTQGEQLWRRYPIIEQQPLLTIRH